MTRNILSFIFTLTAGALACFSDGHSAAAFEWSQFAPVDQRNQLEDKGLHFNAFYAGDMVSNLRGGLKEHTAYLGRLDFGLLLNADQAGLIPGAKFYVSAQDSHSSQTPSAHYVGDIQYVDNNEAPDAFRLYEWWYEQSALRDTVSLRSGLLGLDSEFALSQYGADFINSSFGLPSDITGNIFYSGFSTLGLGSRLRVQPHEKFDFLFALFDGDPTENGKNRHNVNYRFSSRQGLMFVWEAGYHSKVQRSEKVLPHHIKFGSWIHTQNTPDVYSTDENGNAQMHGNDYGFYGIVDQMLFREKKDNEEGLGMFLQWGGAPDDRNMIDYYLGAGLHYKGLIPDRENDVLGIAAGNAFFSERFRSSRDAVIRDFNSTASAGGPPGERMPQETALETTYRIVLNSHLFLQPDYQIVFNPSGEDSLKTAHVFLLRFKLTL